MSFKIDFIESPDQISGDFFFKLHELDQRFFPNPWSLDALKSFTESHNFLMSLIFKKDLLLGFCLLEKQNADSFAHLLKIIIIDEYKGQKLGFNLLNESLIKLSEQKISKFFLEVEWTNVSAIKLYEKLGFKKIHLNKNFYGPNRHAYIMTIESE